MSSPWMQTFTGRRVFPFSFGVDDIDIADIAHALSMTCRFNGHCSRFYSVAEHSLRMSRVVPGRLKLQALIHDAAEAYLGDVPTPLKNAMALCDMSFRHWEDEIEAKIAEHCDLIWPLDPSIKTWDLVLLATEIRDLMSPPPAPWLPLPDPLPETIGQTLSPKKAEELFLFEYERLFLETSNATHK